MVYKISGSRVIRVIAVLSVAVAVMFGPTVAWPGGKSQDQEQIRQGGKGGPAEDGDAPEPSRGIDARNKLGWTALMLAANKGRTDLVKVLLATGSEVNAKNKVGWTALMLAANKGRADIVKLLVRKGADVNTRNEDGWTPLMRAVNNRHAHVVELLKAHGAEVTLTVASMLGDTAEVKRLIASGSDINEKTADGYSPLAAATTRGHADVVRLLTANGAELTLPIAAMLGDTAEVQRFIDAGSDVNQRIIYGWTALMLAARNGKVPMIKILLEKGADVNAKQTSGWTALMHAAYKGHADAAKLLLEKGADVDLTTDNGWTALMMAVSQGHGDVARLILKMGYGLTPPEPGKKRPASQRASKTGHEGTTALAAVRA